MQKALNIGLAVAVILLAVGLATVLLRPLPAMTPGDVRAIVAEALATPAAEAVPAGDAELDPAAIGPAIEEYLLANPRLLERMSVALETELRAEETERARIALTTFQDEIYNDPANIVLGNPQGDVTLVELFDYNCGYCRQMVADVMALVDEDPNLRVILKEFPILSQGSVDAARIGVLVNRADVDYRDFHTALYSARGQVDTAAALAAAEQLGLSPVALELEMTAPDISQALERTYTIAQALGITGTPTFIIGDEVIVGATPKAELAQRIQNVRACGSTTCAQEG